jgi:DNA polymerase-3 subunit epsilon
MLGFIRKKNPPKNDFRVDKKLPLKKVTYAFIDTELTGLNEKTDSIISIGALKMIEGRLELGNSFYSLVNPKTRIGDESIFIHTITPSEVKGARAIEDVLEEFLQFCGHDVLVGHCVSIDLMFINKELKRSLGFTLTNPILDTFTLYSWLWGKWASEPGFSLSPEHLDLYEMAKGFGIPSNGAHNAVMDAFITAQIFQRFLPWLEKSGVDRLEDLLKVGNPFEGGDHRFSRPAQINNL